MTPPRTFLVICTCGMPHQLAEGARCTCPYCGEEVVQHEWGDAEIPEEVPGETSAPDDPMDRLLDAMYNHHPE